MLKETMKKTDLYLHGIIVHLTAIDEDIKVCFARDSSTCHGLATGDVDFYNSKQHFEKFGVQKKTSIS